MKLWCYWNLHKNCVSYKWGSNGTVSHANSMLLADVDFHVLQSGRRKVVEQRKKNVHSFVRGVDIPFLLEVNDEWRKAYYNPYKTETWIDFETGNELKTAQLAFIKDKQVMYIP